MRFDYMPADRNRVLPGATMVAAQASADTEHGVRIVLSGTDVRQETLPATFEFVAPSRQNGMRVRAPTIEYRDESGARFVSVTTPVTCTSLEQQVLRCSFGAVTVRNPHTDATVQLSGGQIEVKLVTDAAADMAVRALHGATGTTP